MKLVLMMALAALASANTGYRQHVLQAPIVGPAQPVPYPQVSHALCLVLLPAIRVVCSLLRTRRQTRSRLYPCSDKGDSTKTIELRYYVT